MQNRGKSGPRLNSKPLRGPFAAFVKERRNQMGLTQKELADLCGLSLDFIKDVEQGKIHLRLERLMTLLDSMGAKVTVELKVVDQSLPFDELEPG
jgi:y4mF family transcriptional regulator